MAEFELDRRLAATSEAVGDLELCHLRLAADGRWPWLLLVPRRTGLVDLTDVSEADRPALWRDLDRCVAAVRALAAARGSAVDKLNVAALGNVVPQLHLHVIARNRADPAWPGPVWSTGEAEPYATGERETALATARAALAY